MTTVRTAIIDKNGKATHVHKGTGQPRIAVTVPTKPAAPSPVLAEPTAAPYDPFAAPDFEGSDDEGSNAEGLHKDFGLPWNKAGETISGETLSELLEEAIEGFSDGNIIVADIKPIVSIREDGEPVCTSMTTEMSYRRSWYETFEKNLIQDHYKQIDPFEAMVFEEYTFGYLTNQYVFGLDYPDYDTALEEASNREPEILAAVAAGWDVVSRDWGVLPLEVDSEALGQSGEYAYLEVVEHSPAYWYATRDSGQEFHEEHDGKLKSVNKLIARYGIPFENAKQLVRDGLRGKNAAAAYSNGIDSSLMNELIHGAD